MWYLAGTAVWQCRAQSQPLWTGYTSGCPKLKSTYTPPRVTSDIYTLQKWLEDFSTSLDLRRASHKLLLSSGLMISNVEAMASTAVPIYWLLALEEVSWLQGFFWTVRIGLSQTVRKSLCFPRRMAKPTLCLCHARGQYSAASIRCLGYLQTDNACIPHSLAQITHSASRFLFFKERDESVLSFLFLLVT